MPTLVARKLPEESAGNAPRRSAWRSDADKSRGTPIDYADVSEIQLEKRTEKKVTENGSRESNRADDVSISSDSYIRRPGRIGRYKGGASEKII